MSLMRLNRYQTDPDSLGQPNNAIAARWAASRVRRCGMLSVVRLLISWHGSRNLVLKLT